MSELLYVGREYGTIILTSSDKESTTRQEDPLQRWPCIDSVGSGKMVLHFAQQPLFKVGRRAFWAYRHFNSGATWQFCQTGLSG